MIQRRYCISSAESLPKILHGIRKTPEYRNAKSVLLKVFTGNFFGEYVREMRDFIVRELPKAKAVFMSQVIHHAEGKSLDAQEEWITLNVCFFAGTSVTVLEYDENDTDYREAGNRFCRKIAEAGNVKAVEVLCTGASKHLSDFIDILSQGHEDIPFFGAEAGIANWDELDILHENIKLGRPHDDVRQYVCADEYHARGAVLILYAGESLHIKVDYILGWHPLGKEMKPALLPGSNTIAALDGIPAGDVYKKYLNVDLDEYFVFNISEFPLLVNRNGCPLARVPVAFDEEKRLYFLGDIRPGDSVQLSYGNVQEILENTWHASEDMRRFQPEGIFLVICGGRNFFIRGGRNFFDSEDAQRELEDYRRIQAQTTACYAASEIYKYQGKGGLLNKALLAVGMREGEASGDMATVPGQAPVSPRKVIPLHIRLANFIQVMTDELKEAAESASKANAAKSQFLSNMSHEIRTPINAILGMDEMILREFDDETLREYAGNIRNAGNSLLGLVNDILDFSKIEAGKMEIIPVDYELGSLLSDLVTILQARAKDKGLQLLVKAAPSLPRMLHGDEIRIKQVITNLLTNAVKYTENGSVALEVCALQQEEDWIDLGISVKDTGIGIREEDIQKLFAAFERIEEKRNRSIEGTGLGMNITQRLLGLMHSELKVESVYGEGSVFSFVLRQKIADGTPMGNFAEASRQAAMKPWAYREKFQAPDAHVLVVDDTLLNLKVFQGLLKQTKVQVDTAESGYDCLARTGERKYDMIFLDHRMPGMDGIETLQRLKSQKENPNADVPIVALTANAISGARETYLAAGFSDYLTKPIDSGQLESMLLAYLPKEKVLEIDSKTANASQTGETLPKWLENAGGLDTSHGVQNCGSVEAYLETVGVFAETLSENADEIESYFRQEDWQSYTVKVHALKSTARIIGAQELSERAKRLEDAGNAGDISGIREGTPDLLRLYRSYTEVLAPLHPAAAPKDLPWIAEDELREAYDALREFTASFDYDSLRFVLESLSAYRLPLEEQERYDCIKSAARKPNWQRLRELLFIAEA